MQAWFGIQTGQRSLVPGCINGGQKGDTPSFLGSTPWYSRQKYVALWHA